MPNNKKYKKTAVGVFIDEVLRPKKLANGDNCTFDEGVERYKELLEEDKTYYKNRAKELSKRSSNVTDQFFKRREETLETPSAFIAKNLDDEKRWLEAKAKAVHERIIKIQNKEELMRKEFIFIAMETFLDTEPHVRPVEVGLVKWSLKKGIIEEFTELVNPGQIPMGSRFSVNDHADRTHQFTEENYKTGTSDYNGLWSNIRSFITYQRSIEPVYCLLQNCGKVSSCLKWINSQISHNELEILVDPIEYLFKEFLTFVGQEMHVQYLQDFLARFNFDMSSVLRCHFHSDPLCEFCALALCKKSIYNILHNLSKIYQFEMTERHVQPNEIIVHDCQPDDDKFHNIRKESKSKVGNISQTIYEEAALLSDSDVSCVGEESDRMSAISDCFTDPSMLTSRGRGGFPLRKIKQDQAYLTLVPGIGRGKRPSCKDK